MIRRLPAPRLLLVTNRMTAKMPLPELANRAISGGVDVVQIRGKDLTEIELMRLCFSVVDSVGNASRVMVNGSPAVARVLGIGLHLPESMARESTVSRDDFERTSRAFHSESETDTAHEYDFAIVGHAFETGGKAGREPLGLDRIHEMVLRIGIPVLAIGGMLPDRVPAVRKAGVYGVAVLSAINESPEPEIVAAAFKLAMENAMADVKLSEISITLNGKQAAIPGGSTVTSYLAGRGFHERMVVVELNGSILAKKDFAVTALSAGDKVEIVHFVGGG